MGLCTDVIPGKSGALMGSLMFKPAAEAWGVGPVLVLCAFFSLAGTVERITTRGESRRRSVHMCTQFEFTIDLYQSSRGVEKGRCFKRQLLD